MVANWYNGKNFVVLFHSYVFKVTKNYYGKKTARNSNSALCIKKTSITIPLLVNTVVKRTKLLSVAEDTCSFFLLLSSCHLSLSIPPQNIRKPIIGKFQIPESF